jgi:8-oxo-dGTP diphosphatase
VILNQENEILLVQERKPASYGKYNLPGGHLEIGEKIAVGVKREVKEEVNLEVEPEYLVGIFTGVGKHHFVNYVFYTEIIDQEPEPQFSEILDCKWLSIDEILNTDEGELLNPIKLKSITERVRDKTLYKIDLIMELF